MTDYKVELSEPVEIGEVWYKVSFDFSRPERVELYYPYDGLKLKKEIIDINDRQD